MRQIHFPVRAMSILLSTSLLIVLAACGSNGSGVSAVNASTLSGEGNSESSPPASGVSSVSADRSSPASNRSNAPGPDSSGESPISSASNRSSALTPDSSGAASRLSTNYTAKFLVPPTLNYTSAGSDQGSFFTDGFAVVGVGTAFGYLDPNGNLLDGSTYLNAFPFDEVSHLALIQKDDGTYAYIDPSGAEKITSINGAPFTDQKYHPSGFTNGLAVITDMSAGFSMGPDAVIDAAGNVLIPFDDTNVYKYQISGGVILRFKGQNPNPVPDAVLNTSGSVLFSVPKDVGAVSGFENGVGFFEEDTADGPLYGLMDTTGEKLTGAIYASQAPDSPGFCDGVALVVPASDPETMELINPDGHVLLQTDVKQASITDNTVVIGSTLYSTAGAKIKGTDMDSIGGFSNGIAACEKGGKYGLIDTEGNVVIAPTWAADTFNYSEGLAVVVQNGKMGVLQITKS